LEDVFFREFFKPFLGTQEERIKSPTPQIIPDWFCLQERRGEVKQEMKIEKKPKPKIS